MARRGSSRLLVGAFFTALLGSMPAWSECQNVDLKARELVEKMSHSLREQNYRGIFTYQYGTTIESLNIEHTVVDGVENETLMHLNGNRRTVVRRAHPLNCVHPGHRLLQVASNLGGDCGFTAHYKLKVTGNERLAGRQAVRLQISPQDMYRYGYLLAVDQKTGLLLKSQVMGHDGKVLERFQFADLDVGATPSLEDLAPGDHVAHHPDVAVQDTPDGENTWQIDWIPEGFLPTAADVTMAGQVRTYTDGLAVFSVFLEARQPARNPAAGGEGSAQQGATTAFTRTVKLAGNAWLVTVIGEVPVNTARRVADSVTVPG